MCKTWGSISLPIASQLALLPTYLCCPVQQNKMETKSYKCFLKWFIFVKFLFSSCWPLMSVYVHVCVKKLCGMYTASCCQTFCMLVLLLLLYMFVIRENKDLFDWIKNSEDPTSIQILCLVLQLYHLYELLDFSRNAIPNYRIRKQDTFFKKIQMVNGLHVCVFVCMHAWSNSNSMGLSMWLTMTG